MSLTNWCVSPMCLLHDIQSMWGWTFESMYLEYLPLAPEFQSSVTVLGERWNSRFVCWRLWCIVCYLGKMSYSVVFNLVFMDINGYPQYVSWLSWGLVCVAIVPLEMLQYGSLVCPTHCILKVWQVSSYIRFKLLHVKFFLRPYVLPVMVPVIFPHRSRLGQ